MRAVSITNRGGRKNNEDCILSTEANGIRCFALCDGLGGQLCGEVASRIVCSSVCAEFEKNPEISPKSLYRYIEKAASVLGEERESDESRYNMSSTLVALVTDGNSAVWGHAGDSRLYYISGGKIVSITNDHSVSFMEYEGGMITYSEIRKSPNQNRLTRCINDIYDLNPDLSEVTEVVRGDAFLLCSDGFWEYVGEEDIERTLNESASPKEWLEAMLKTLHENEIEKNDNYSAVAVFI